MTKTTTVTITDFLLARIAEDEAVARAATTVGVPRVKHLGGGNYGQPYVEQRDVADDVRREVVWFIAPGLSSPGSSGTDQAGTALFARFDPARVLAECEAKRRIVEAAMEANNQGGGAEIVMFGGYPAIHPGRPKIPAVLASLASVYAGHSDYDASWA